MTEGELTPSRKQSSDTPMFWQFALWGVSAMLALSLVAHFATSEPGWRRLVHAFSSPESAAPAAPTKVVIQPRESSEIARLSDALRTLSADRERLAARLAAVERNLDDLTGSIARTPASAGADEAAPPAAPEPTYTHTVPSAGIPPPAQASRPPSPAPSQAAPTAEEQAAPPAAQKAEFGVDLGSAPTVEGLRALWKSTKSRHATLLADLRPLVAIREQPRSGAVELRLVVGPIASAALAARLCVVLAKAGALCQPVPYEGQRLAVR